MALDATAVRVAGTGEAYFAPEGTTAPTDATTALNAAFLGLGYTDPDGCQFTFSRNTTDIDAWQGSKLRVVSNSEPVSVTLKLMETKTNTLLFAFGGGTVGANTFTPPVEGVNAVRAFVVDVTDVSLKYRYYFPRAQIAGDVSFQLARTNAVGYDLTVGILANVPKFKIFTNDTAALTPGS
jgi:hypothetical protein